MPQKKDGIPDQDPYDLLGVPFHASRAEISRSYRKLALKFHPDKQLQRNNASAEEIVKKFHDIKAARSFLLDDEYAEARRKFDAKRESDRLRQRTETLREKNMSERRKRLKQELKEKEMLAVRQKKEKNRFTPREKQDEVIIQLRGEGKRKRQEHVEHFFERDGKAEGLAQVDARLRGKSEKDKLEQRQVRLKWDRKKMKSNPSEDYIIKLLSERFGRIETVEILSKKGNQALVTFMDQSSCRPCVEYFATSVILRAKYVGKRRTEYEQTKQSNFAQEVGFKYANESLEQRRLRQAAEREELMQKIEGGDIDSEMNHSSRGKKWNADSIEKNKDPKHRSYRPRRIVPKFPLALPTKLHNHANSSIEVLEIVETHVFGSLNTEESTPSIKIATKMTVTAPNT